MGMSKQQQFLFLEELFLNIFWIEALWLSDPGEPRVVDIIVLSAHVHHAVPCCVSYTSEGCQDHGDRYIHDNATQILTSSRQW